MPSKNRWRLSFPPPHEVAISTGRSLFGKSPVKAAVPCKTLSTYIRSVAPSYVPTTWCHWSSKRLVLDSTMGLVAQSKLLPKPQSIFPQDGSDRDGDNFPWNSQPTVSTKPCDLSITKKCLSNISVLYD